jgi:hypothetical protein
MACGTLPESNKTNNTGDVFISQGVPKFPLAPPLEGKRKPLPEPGIVGGSEPIGLPVVEASPPEEMITVVVQPAPPKKSKKKKPCYEEVIHYEYEYQYFGSCNCYQYVPVQYIYYYPCGGRW